jgi:DNA-binding transcriptional MocR family regulator
MATVGTQKSLGDGKSKDKPEPLDLSHHFSIMAQRRTESSVTKFIGGLSTTTFNLGPGFPFAGNFPLDTLEGAIAKPRRLPLHSVSGVTLPDTDTSRFTVPKVSMDSQSNNPDTEIDLSTALQYQASTGYPSLAAFIQDWAVNYQNQGNIPYKDPETLITCGALDGLAKSLMTFSDPGDNILVEEYVYISAKDNILPFGLGLAAVNIDQEGMSAKSLEHILGNWDETIQGKRPRLMYTVT